MQQAEATRTWSGSRVGGEGADGSAVTPGQGGRWHRGQECSQGPERGREETSLPATVTPGCAGSSEFELSLVGALLALQEPSSFWS